MKLVSSSVVLAIAIAPALAQQTTLVSENLGGGTPTGGAFWPSLSDDGQVVVFDSGGTELVPVDANGPVGDVFVRDLASGVTELVSLSSSGIQANGVSYFGRITPDARFVCFVSAANNLVIPSDPDSYDDVFRRDLLVGTTIKASLSISGSPDGASGNCDISDDGSRIVFTSAASNLVEGDANGLQDIFVRDLAAGATLLVSRGLGGGSGNGDSFQPKISGDGLWVVFGSAASDLVPGDTNGQYDVFRCELATGALERLSESSAGQQGNGASTDPVVSRDGRITVFASSATNLVSGDTNGWKDLFAHDALRGTTELVSQSQAGALANYSSFHAAISADGRYVAFTTGATNLTAPPTFMPGCVALLDRDSGAIQAASFSRCSVPLDQLVMPEISPDGSLVAFVSAAAHAVADDVNSHYDVFVHDPAAPAIAPPCTYCLIAPTSSGCLPSISASGTPSASAASGFVLTVTGVEGQRNGLFIHGSDSITTPWGVNGPSYLCVFNQGRFGFQDSGGTSGQCDGVMTFDWNALATWPQAGQSIMAQAWFRDPPSQKGTHMSNAISFIAGP
jgi:Tol biopolymer transport system component